MLAQFEEKELEGPLNAQLCGGSGLLWSPGQVLEAVVGFDAALMVTDISFWASLGFGHVPHGLPVQSSWWPGWPSLLLRPLFMFRTPPHFRLNLFLQYKRPEHLERGKEAGHWNSAYFRFAVTPHQQRALEACARSLGVDGHVAYGSPAFFKRADLFTHTENRTLASNTHFAPAMDLATHSLYTYVSARAPGKAHSEPVEVKPLLFLNEPPQDPPEPPGDGGPPDGEAPNALLSAAKKAARASAEASPTIVGSRELYERAIERARRAITFIQPGLDERGRAAADAYVVAAIFSRMSGIQWMIGA